MLPLFVLGLSHWQEVLSGETGVRNDLLWLAVVVLPVGQLLAWWLAWRMMRPLEYLRRQALQLAPVARKGADLKLNRRDEFGDLASAFNALLHALESRQRANEEFVADLAHEFKNPVSAIRAAAESLSGGNPDATRVARLARVLADSSQRLDALVTQFLELARAEAGLVREARVEVDLGQLCRGIAQAVTAQDASKDVTISVDGKWSAHVEGIPGRLESALRNLVDNAVSFAGSGGWVRISIEEIGDCVHLRVADSGPGISDVELPRVFDRFYTTRGERRGTGLGLALVRAVVEAHGGHVRVESPPERGAVFEVVLPAAP